MTDFMLTFFPAIFISNQAIDSNSMIIFQAPVSGEAPIVPSTVTIPEEWPVVPIVAVNRCQENLLRKKF